MYFNTSTNGAICEVSRSDVTNSGELGRKAGGLQVHAILTHKQLQLGTSCLNVLLFICTNLYLLKWNFERERLVIIRIERTLLYRGLLLLDTLTI